MHCGRVLDFTGACATAAYVLARRHRLALAGSTIYSMAQEQGATFWTQDVDYDGKNGMRYFAGPSA